jgi:YD repeat-containing protein
MRSRHAWVGALLTQGLMMSTAYAVEGPAPGAVSAQTLKLPDGPGSVKGLASDPSVSAFSGQLSYEVPLELPGARRDFRPQLALSYRGDLGNGPLGVGWSMRQVEIRRSTRLGTPKFLATDELELVGVGPSGRLVAAGDGSFRVEGRGNDVKIVVEAGGYRVFDADGVQYRLGQSAAARQSEGARTVSWKAEEVIEPTGQHVVFSYLQDRGQMYLTQASWGPGDAYHVVLELADRPDAVTSYREGISVVTGKRVAAIRVEAFGEVLRRYELAYDQRFALSRLSSVRMLGRGGLGSLPPVSFSYASTTAPQLAPMTGLDGWRLNARGVSLVDVDGDGVEDLLRLDPGNHMYRKNLGAGAFSAPILLTGADAQSLDSARLIDVEGRARPNLVSVNAGAWSPYRLSGAGWTAIGAWSGTDQVPLMGSDVVMADLNGDGRIDVLQWNPTGLKVRLGNAAGLDAPFLTGLIGGSVLPGADVLWSDVNGDGLADAVQLTTTAMNVFFGRGDGTFEPRQQVAYPPGAEGVLPSRIRLGDLDRDGLVDLVVVSSTAVDLYAGRPNAQLFNPNAVRLAGPEDAGLDVVIALADANGNGSEDVVWSSPRGSWLLDLAGSTTAGMLVGVDNGMGKTLAISYEASATLARDAATAGRPWARSLQVSMPVVTRTVMTLGDGSPARVVEYDVRDGFWDATEFTFGGFLVGRETHRGGTPGRDLVTETSYHQGTGVNRVLRGKPVVVTRSDGTGKIFDISTYRWLAAPISDLGTSPLLRKGVVSEAWTDSFEGTTTPVRVHTLYEVDGQGRVFRETDDGRTDLVGDERVVTRSYGSDAAHWVRDRVCEEKTTGAGGVLLADARTFYGDATTTLPACTIGLGWKKQVQGWLADGAGRWVTLEDNSFDGFGNTVASTKEGVTRTMAYDANGLHPVRETVSPASGQTLAWTAVWDDVQGVPRTITDPAGATTRLAYDTLGRVVSTASGTAPPHVYYQYDWERATPRTTTYQFDGAVANLPATLPAWAPGNGWRQIVEVVNGSSEVVAHATRLGASSWIMDELRVRDGRGGVVFRAEPYVVTGAEVSTALPAGALGQRLSFDAIDRVLSESLPNGAVKSSTYGTFSVRLDTTDLASVSTRFDGRGRAIRTERAVGATLEATDTAYDALDHILSFTTGAVVSSFSYDSLGRMVAATDPDVGPRRLAYDDAGRLVDHQNGAGQHVSYVYDPAGRLIEQKLDGVSTLRYHYDTPRVVGLGFTGSRLAWAEDPEGTVDLGYDALGRTTSIKRVVRGVTATESRSYAASGFPLSVSYDDGFSYSMSYDPAGRLVGIPGLWQAQSLDAAGRPLSERFGNGVVQRTERDVLGFPGRVRVENASGALYDVSATRASFGALATVVDSDGVGLDHSATFAYDAAGRLTSARLGQVAPYQFGYAYDSLQNLVARTVTGPAAVPGLVAGSYRYGENGAGPRQLTSVAGATPVAFGYDAAGRQTSATGKSFAYNAMDQLTQVGIASAITRHAYGWDGQRSLTVAPDGSISRWFSTSLVEHDGVRDHYVHVGDRLVARVRTGGVVTAAKSAGVIGAIARDAAVALGAFALLAALASLLLPLARGRRRLLGAGTAALVATATLGGCAGPVEQVNAMRLELVNGGAAFASMVSASSGLDGIQTSPHGIAGPYVVRPD